MGQAEYEDFKAKLREWMEAHPEEYAAFEESMNTRDMAGCQAVLLQAIALIPQYRKARGGQGQRGAVRPCRRNRTGRPRQRPRPQA